MNNYDVINAALNSWLENNIENMDYFTQAPTSYYQVGRNNPDEDLFITASSSAQRLVDMSHSHALHCKCSLKLVKSVYR